MTRNCRPTCLRSLSKPILTVPLVDLRNAVMTPTWMRRNFMKLNDDKAEVLLAGSRQQLSNIALPGMTDGE